MTKNPAFLIRLLDYTRITDRIRNLKKTTTFVAALVEFFTERRIQTDRVHYGSSLQESPLIK